MQVLSQPPFFLPFPQPHSLIISHPSQARAVALSATGPVINHQFCTKDVSRILSWSSAPGSTPLNLTYIPRPPHFQSTLGAHGSCRMDRASTGGFGTGHSPSTPPQASPAVTPCPCQPQFPITLRFSCCESSAYASCSRPK